MRNQKTLCFFPIQNQEEANEGERQIQSLIKRFVAVMVAAVKQQTDNSSLTFLPCSDLSLGKRERERTAESGRKT